MAITLDPELAAAQNSMERKPIINLLATQVLDSMPFDGNLFNNIDDTEKYTDLITSEDGHIIGVYTISRNIVLVHTDLSKVVWETTSTYYWSGRSFLGVSIEEIEVGSIGTLFLDGGRLMTSIIDESTGAFTSGPSVIESFASPEYSNSVVVRKLLDGSFLCAYVVLNTTLDTYEIRTRTSGDFISWSAASTVSIPELIAGRPIDNVNLLAMSSGDIMLFFDYATLEKEDETLTVTNVYMVTSYDNGLSWLDLDQITNFTAYGTAALDPSADEKADGSIALAYTDSKRVLFANSSMLLWDNNDCGTWSNYNASNIHFDPVTRRCYIYQIRSYAGINAFCGVIVIDVDLWEVVEVYNAHTNPGYTSYFQNVQVSIGTDVGAGEFAVISAGVVCVLINDKENTIKQYILTDLTDYELDRTVDYTPFRIPYRGDVSGGFQCTYMDEQERKLYCLLKYGDPFNTLMKLGYFDVDEPADVTTGLYTFNEIVQHSKVLSSLVGRGMLLVRERNIMVIEGQSRLPPKYVGQLLILDLTSGGIIKNYRKSEYENFPVGGVQCVTYLDGCIYGSFPYVTSDGEDTKRGMVKINLDTDEITYHAPTYTTANDYALRQKITTNDGRILIATNGGVAEFTPANGSWHLYGDSTVPGFESNASISKCTAVAYDELEQNILVGSISTITTGAFTGLRMFNETGAYNIGQYTIASKTDEWNWGAVVDLTRGHEATDNALTIDTENVAWSIWSDSSSDYLSTLWDQDIKELPLEDLLVAGKDVTITRSVENTGQLTFTLAHGHLFDQNNTLSTWNSFVKKGKVIDIAMGEDIDGIAYLKKQGTFIVDSAKVTYSRGSYPEITVNCVQPDIVWSNIRVEATPRYDSTYPEELLRDLIMTHALFGADMIDIATFPNRHDIHHQWIDVDLKSLVMEFLGHFQSIPYFDEEGIFTTKVMSPHKSTDHVYTGAELIDFTPDESYSSFTNQITVTGEGLYTLEVTYPEELIDTVSGTAGWWEGGKRQVTVNYSNTKDLVCYDPRMHIKQSIHDFELFDDLYPNNIEEITHIDPENRYCIVTVELPGLMAVLLGLLASTFGLAVAANSCTINCGPFIYGIAVLQLGISWIVSQVVSYEYEIYAKPTGEEKQLLSYTIDDLPFQQELGGIVASEVYDDPYCYTAQSCRAVGEYEMSIVKAQRKRVSFSKLAHLQDELLDKIRINHPYSGVPIDVVITDLTRVYNKPPRGSFTGSFKDKITGWVV